MGITNLLDPTLFDHFFYSIDYINTFFGAQYPAAGKVIDIAMLHTCSDVLDRGCLVKTTLEDNARQAIEAAVVVRSLVELQPQYNLAV